MKSLQDMESVAVQQRTTVSTTMSDVTSGMKDMEIVESVQHRADNIDDRGLSNFRTSRHGNLANQSTLVKRTSAKGKRKHDDDKLLNRLQYSNEPNALRLLIFV